jgi:sulfopyruvate decarboxylase TPP-binding subunit
MTWSDTFLGILTDNDVRLISYVPDNVLTPLLKGVTADNYFLSVCATREDEGPSARSLAPIWPGCAAR